MVMAESREPKDPAATPEERSRASKQLVPLLAGVAVVALALGMDVTLCPTSGLFGIPCPSCGLTRATAALLSGDIGRAHVAHPAVLPVLIYLGASAVTLVWRPNSKTQRVVSALGLLLVVGLIVLWGARFAGAFGGPATVERWYRGCS